MPALQGNRSNSAGRIPVVDAFHADPLHGQRMFLNRIRRFFGSGMGNRTGNLAGPAGKALFNDAINTFQRCFPKLINRIAAGFFPIHKNP
jgi:hypothetical protein